MDYEYLAMTLSAMVGIPVRLYREGKFVGVWHITKFKPDLAILEEKNILKIRDSVGYYMTSEFLIYGLLRADRDGVCMVLGPVAHAPIDTKTARKILMSVGEPPSRVGELMYYLNTITSSPLRNFLQTLCTVAYMVNGEKVFVSDLFQKEPGASGTEAGVPSAKRSDQEVPAHDTYEIEQEVLGYVEHGRPEELERLYRMPAVGKAGKMVEDVLRQEKNLMVVTTTLASRAAIRGGLDVESALNLSDLYIQKAELTNSYEGLQQLSGQMLLDYAERVANLHCGEMNRKLIRSVRQYILEHINEKITTEAVAAAVDRNRSYLCTRFREETGMSLSEYVTRTKIDEARRLLKATGKPLKEISDQLGFSSQSHFQNVFKKITGVTPTEYRVRKRA